MTIGKSTLQPCWCLLMFKNSVLRIQKTFIQAILIEVRCCLHWRYLSAHRASHSNGLVSLRHTHRPSLWTLHRRHPSNLQILALNLLPPNRPRRRSNNRCLLSASRNLTPHESRRSRRSPTKSKSQSPLGNAESVESIETLQIPEFDYGVLGFFFPGVEYVFPAYSYPLCPQSSLQPYNTHPIRALLPRSRLWIYPRYLWRRQIRRLHHHLLAKETRRGPNP